jgi:hypothetical protein
LEGITQPRRIKREDAFVFSREALLDSMSALVFRIVRRATLGAESLFVRIPRNTDIDLGASCLLAIAILGMAAQVTHTALQLHVSPFYFAKLAIASSSITTVTLPVMYVAHASFPICEGSLMSLPGCTSIGIGPALTLRSS